MGKFLLKLFLVTVGFLVGGYILLLIIAITVQSHIHPDEWVVTQPEKVTALILLLVYFRVTYKSWKNYRIEVSSQEKEQ